MGVGVDSYKIVGYHLTHKEYNDIIEASAFDTDEVMDYIYDTYERNTRNKLVDMPVSFIIDGMDAEYAVIGKVLEHYKTDEFADLPYVITFDIGETLLKIITDDINYILTNDDMIPGTLVKELRNKALQPMFLTHYH